MVHEEAQRILSRLVRNLATMQIRKDRLQKQFSECFAILEERPSNALERMQRIIQSIPENQRSPFVEAFDNLRDQLAHSKKAVQDGVGYVDVAVICALRSPELDPVLDLLEGYQVVDSDSAGSPDVHTYYLGEISKPGITQKLRVVAAAQNAMGMTDCAVLATKILLRWRPRYLVMTGVAGGRVGKVRLGDIIVPDEIFNYQSGKVTNRGFEPDPSPVRLDERTIQRVRHLRNEFVDRIWRGWTGEDYGTPRVHIGPMACGYSVVDKKGMMEEIARVNRRVIALDMESYAIVRAAQLCARPRSHDNCTPVIIKSVMDFTIGKEDGAKNYAAYTSAQFLYHFAMTEWINELSHTDEETD